MGDLVSLRADLGSLERVVVAFSGGADSAFLAFVANEVLGQAALAVTAVSPSLPSSERDACAALAEQWGMRWQEVETDEMERAAYVANGTDRCWHCKDALMDALVPLAGESDTVVLGVNLDDLDDYRPGQQAASSRGARFPLVDAGFTKADVRTASKALGLSTWDKPAAACLSSRLPHGTPVTLSALGTVQRAEAALRELGLRQVRVRHHGELARVEVGSDELETAFASRSAIADACRSAGYRWASLDLDGYRQGSLNTPPSQ